MSTDKSKPDATPTDLADEALEEAQGAGYADLFKQSATVGTSVNETSVRVEFGGAEIPNPVEAEMSLSKTVGDDVEKLGALRKRLPR